MEAKELVNCPECSNRLHSHAAFVGQPCPSCGTVLSKHGKDRRSSPRIIKSIPCILYVEGDYDRISFPAKTIDISDSGIGISYSIFPLPQNAIVELEIVELATIRPSVVVWTKEISKIESKSGLRFIRPIQRTSPPTA